MHLIYILSFTSNKNLLVLQLIRKQKLRKRKTEKNKKKRESVLVHLGLSGTVRGPARNATIFNLVSWPSRARGRMRSHVDGDTAMLQRHGAAYKDPRESPENPSTPEPPLPCLSSRSR